MRMALPVVADSLMSRWRLRGRRLVLVLTYRLEAWSRVSRNVEVVHSWGEEGSAWGYCIGDPCPGLPKVAGLLAFVALVQAGVVLVV